MKINVLKQILWHQHIRGLRHQHLHLAELSFCELEVKRETILRCAEWVKENLNLDESSALLRPGVIADLMIKDLLNKE